MNNRHLRESSRQRGKRFGKPLFWIGIVMLAAAMGLMSNRWMQGESLLYAAVPPLQLETSGGFYELGQTSGKVLILFFSFPG